jgi:hypothetical protein
MVLRTHKLDSERTASTALAVRIGVSASVRYRGDSAVTRSLNRPRGGRNT